MICAFAWCVAWRAGIDHQLFGEGQIGPGGVTAVVPVLPHIPAIRLDSGFVALHVHHQEVVGMAPGI
jgi:hypothetical protein